MAEPARQHDWNDEGNSHEWHPEVLRGGGQGGEAPLEGPRLVKSDKTPEEEAPGKATKVPYLRQIEGNPNAQKDATAAKPELHALGRNEDNFASDKKGDGRQTSLAGGDVATGKQSGLKRSLKFVMRHKKATAAIGGTLAGGGILGIFSVSLLLPLKILSVVNNLDTYFQSATTAATTKMTDNLLNGYISKYVLPGINHGTCTDTFTSPGCVANVSGKGPVSRLYEAWHQDRLEHKLATDYGIVFGKDKAGLYMKVKGPDSPAVLNDADMQKVFNGEATIFDVGGEKTTITEARAALRDALDGESLWKRMYFRFKFGRLLEEKYGVSRCVIACNLRDKFTASIADKKLTAEATIIDRVFSKIAPEYSIIFQCMLSPDTCGDQLQNISNASTDPTLPPEDTQLTQYESDMQGRLLAYAGDDMAKLAQLADLVEEAKKVSQQGLTTYLASKIVAYAIGPEAGDAVASFGEKAVPIVGWVMLAAQVLSALNKLGPFLQHADYMVNAAAAVNLYMSYKTVASEMESGHVDSTELGSFNEALSTNLDGSSSDQADVTSTPLYGAINNTGVNASKTTYKCNDGSSVQSGQLVCPEEVLDAGNAAATFLSDLTNDAGPVTWFANLLTNNPITNLFNAIIGKGMQAVQAVCSAIPPCNATVNELTSLIGQFAGWVIGLLIPSPFSQHMSGGRTYDMMAAGADVSANKTCQVSLGCQKLSNQQVADIRNSVIAQDKADFSRLPLFARLFSTTSQYSLLSRVAVSMPSTLPQAAANVSAVISNPFAAIAHSFANILSSDRAFAATTLTSDPFGVIQYGYPTGQVPTDPETYWDQHCTNNQTNVDWFNQQQQDANTGEAVATTTDPCLLILSMVQSAGGAMDYSLLPPDAISSNESGSNPTSGGGGGVTGSCATAAPTGSYAAVQSALLAQFKINLIGDTSLDWATQTYNTMCALAKAPAYFSRLVAAGPITVNLHAGSCNGGHSSAVSGVDMYGFCDHDYNRFLLAHELGHMFSFRNPTVYQAFAQQVWLSRGYKNPPTLPTYNCLYDYGVGPYEAECWADMIGEYLVWFDIRDTVGGRPAGTPTFSQYQSQYPIYYNFARDQLFGGVQYTSF